MVNLAKILKPHGLKGAMKINPFTDNFSAFKKYSHFFINEKKYQVEYFKGDNSPLIVKLENIDTIEEVIALKNNFLSLERNMLNEKPGELIEDYLGLAVFSDEGEALGIIKECYAGGTHMFYRIISKEQENLYVPCEKDLFQAIDFSKKTLTLKAGVL